MTQSILQPKPLNEWLAVLDRTALPVRSGQKERVQQIMANPASSLNDIAQVISEAPSIALILFREANRSTSSLGEPAYRLDMVLQRLGMARCSTLLASLIDESQLPIPSSLRQVWLIGQHANYLANALFAHSMARLWQEIHWSSLLFLSPLWPLLTRHPELLDLWEQRVLGNNEQACLVERELLGVPLIKLCHALARHWSLPQWVIDGYATLGSNRKIMARALYLARLHNQPLEQQQRLDAQKDLNSWLSQPANSIVLANGLALASHNAWGDNHCLRWQRLLSLYLRQPLATVQQNTHQASVEHARQIGPTSLWHPAQGLIWPWHTRRFQPGQALPSTESSSRLVEQRNRLVRWRELAQQLIQRPSPFDSSLQLLSHYAAMLQQARFSRVLIAKVQPRNNSLILIHQSNFSFALHTPLPDSINNPVFRHVLGHRQYLHIGPHNHAKVTGHLSHDLLTTLDSRNLVMGSIWLKDQPLLLVIADNRGKALQESNLKLFSASNRYLERSLAR